MEVRQLKLRNRLGQEFDFMRKDAFLYDISGFGWGREVETVRIGDNFIVTDDYIETPSPSGTLAAATYEVVEEFRAFIQIGGLTLCYRPKSTINWRYIDVYVTLGVTEIDEKTGYLHCDVQFTRVSQFYEQTIFYRNVSDLGAGEVKDYISPTDTRITSGYKYPYKYGILTTNKITIQNGNLDSYFKLTIYGPVTNPAYVLFKDGVQVHNGKIKTTIVRGHKLVINTLPDKSEITEYEADDTFVRDCYGLQDWGTDVIFAIKNGENVMVFNDDTYAIPNVVLEVYKNV